MSNSKKNAPAYLLLIVCATIIALAGMGGALILALDKSRDTNTAVIMAFLGFVGTIVGAVAFIMQKLEDTSAKVDTNTDGLHTLNNTVRNGGLETPIKRALNSPEGHNAIARAAETAVHNAIKKEVISHD